MHCSQFCDCPSPPPGHLRAQAGKAWQCLAPWPKKLWQMPGPGAPDCIFCTARGRSSARIFYAFYIFTIKFSKSPARNFQTLQSGRGTLTHL
jgi:hypothetical protein